MRGNRTKSLGKRKPERMLGTNHAKSLGKRRKPERTLGTNHDDAVKMLEKYSESAGKCDNNQRKMVQKPSENEGDGGAIKKSNRPGFYAKQF